MPKPSWAQRKAGSEWERIRCQVLERDDFCCQYLEDGEICGEAEMPLHVHHVVPKGRHGGDELSNLVTLCEEHHQKMHPKFEF